MIFEETWAVRPWAEPVRVWIFTPPNGATLAINESGYVTNLESLTGRKGTVEGNYKCALRATIDLIRQDMALKPDDVLRLEARELAERRISERRSLLRDLMEKEGHGP